MEKKTTFSGYPIQEEEDDRNKGVELGWGANGLRQGRGAGMEEGMVRERDLSGIQTGWHS